MSIEIERKFLVQNHDFKNQSVKTTFIKQGYLSTDPERTVRVRIKGDKAYITIKGLSSNTGMTRYEWEKEIDIIDAEDIMTLCLPGRIEKIRYNVPSGKHQIEVDYFLGENEGLILAEIELNDENEAIILPHWIGIEVTGDARYYNAQLISTPYKKWKK